MLSLLIINSKIYDRYLDYVDYFKWFEDHTDFRVCVWNAEASPRANVEEMVPKLYGTIGDTEEWNAYIVNEPFESADFIDRDFNDCTQFSINPYERSGGKVDYDPEMDNLLRLTYFLGGHGSDELKYEEEYRFKGTRPEQIYLLTPRVLESLMQQKIRLQESIEENFKRKNNPQEPEESPESLASEFDTMFVRTIDNLPPYSAFWDRYRYPLNCRFLVFDFPENDNVHVEQAWFLFWLSAVTMMQNEFMTDEVSGQKVYVLDVRISEMELEQFLNRFYFALKHAYDDVDSQIEEEVRAMQKASQDTSSNHPGVCAPVFVMFPDVDFSAFSAPTDSFGIAKDVPSLDTDIWDKHERQVTEETRLLFKAAERGRREAAEDMNRTVQSEICLYKDRVMTRYDMDDLREDADAAELMMVKLKKKVSVSLESFRKEEAKASRNVEKALSPRVFFKTFLKLMGIGVLIGLAGFIPFVFTSARYNATSFLIALVIAIVAEGVVVLAAFIGLIVQRRKLDRPLIEYDKAVSESLEKLRANADTDSAYLTQMLNYMVKYQILVTGKIEDRYTDKIKELAGIRAVFGSAMEKFRTLAAQNQIFLKTEEDEDLRRDPVRFLPGEPIYLHEDTENRTIALNHEPDRLNTPFLFVEKLEINEEAVYESEVYKNYVSTTE